MQAPKTGKSVFQHRGYQCDTCKQTTQVYGREPAPDICLQCGVVAPMVIKWNHIVTSTQEIRDTDQTWD